MSKLFYLATPYSKYKLGLNAAFEMACVVAGDLRRAGILVYSPIAHSHPIATIARMDPLDYKIWMPMDEAVMPSCFGMIVYRAPGWDESTGIAEEIKAFTRMEKPIGYIGPGPISNPDVVKMLDQIERDKHARHSRGS